MESPPLPPGSSECTDLPRCLARDLLLIEEGAQSPSTRELAERYHASLGSVSAALNNLEEMGAVKLTRRGRLGAFVEQKSIGRLWRIIENGPLVVALTLPSYPKSEGLATALYSLLDSAGIETYLIFIRGSNNRLKALRMGRCHAAVTSVLAAEALCSPTEEILLRLPPQSFVTDHRVFYRRGCPAGGLPLQVGIDRDSFDIAYLTELEFAGQNVCYIPMPFVQADRNFEKSAVDAAISNLDHLQRGADERIASRPLSPAVQARIGERDTAAAIILRAGESAAQYLLGKLLQPAQILEIQQQVVDGLLVPRY